MKKLLFIVLSLILTFLFALSGCSCEVSQPLSFNKAYLVDISNGDHHYTETLSYAVTYKPVYQNISNASDLDDDKIVECGFNGNYDVYFSNKLNELPEGITTNINFKEEQDLHYIKSTLNLSFTVNGKTYNDQIISEVYFYSRDFSLAPVYSITTMKYTYFFLNIEDELTQVIYQYSNTYNKSKYRSTKMCYQAETDEDINDIDLTMTAETYKGSLGYFDLTKLKPISGNGKSHEYELKRVIDNNQLMFAIRNSNLSATIPTISFTYDDAVEITANNRNTVDYEIKGLTYNGQAIPDTTMKVKNVEFGINATNNRGSSKYMYIQKEAVNGINNNALIVEYAEPLLSGFANVGALVYKLTNATVTIV